MVTHLPPFHPDHPHNHPQYQSQYQYQRSGGTTPLGQASLNLPFTTAPTTPPRRIGFKTKMSVEEMSDASLSPKEDRTCFCGNVIKDGEGIYCSAGCARSDAFSTLCNRPNPPSLASSIALGLSRPSTAASSVSSTQENDDAYVQSHISSHETANSSSAGGGGEWESHYRSMCRADLRREERKEERRRRRAEGSTASSSTASVSRGTIMSTCSTSANRVPDLVGGHGHSRNASVASTSSRTSYASSGGGLSRNPSTASSASSSRRGYGGFNVDTAIMEDDDEAEWLAPSLDLGHGHGNNGLDHGLPHPYGINMPPTIRMPVPTIRAPHGLQPIHRRRGSHVSTKSASSIRKKLEPFGMGQDMRDVLEEIIQMEKEFIIDESSDDTSASTRSRSNGNGLQPGGVFTAVFDRPPRTPSPVMDTRRQSVIPGAPARGHRKSMSIPVRPNIHFDQSNQGQEPKPPHAQGQRTRPGPPPAFTYGHSASLSESHTALYLATASPESATRQSASPPKLKARNSMTFTPEAAGPIIPPFLGSGSGSGSGSDGMGMGISPNMTPSRRRPGHYHSPTAHHPAMSGWKFPASANGHSGNGNSNTATPTKLSIDTQNLHAVHTPTSRKSKSRSRSHGHGQDEFQPQPQLLWPPGDLALQPSRPHSGHRQRQVSPPDSGLRLGVLLGLGEEAMEVDEGYSGPDIQFGFNQEYGHGYNSGRGPYSFSPDLEDEAEGIRFD